MVVDLNNWVVVEVVIEFGLVVFVLGDRLNLFVVDRLIEFLVENMQPHLSVAVEDKLEFLVLDIQQYFVEVNFEHFVVDMQPVHLELYVSGHDVKVSMVLYM